MKKQKTIQLSAQVRRWHQMDLSGRILGRASTEIAALLMGKNKIGYSPNLDNGDYVVATNAQSIMLSRKKAGKKVYQWHTNHPGGFRERSFAELLEKNPEQIIQKAVNGMLPKNKLRDARLARLKVFRAATHPYQEKFRSKKS